MKKIYIIPTTEIINVNVESHLLTESTNGGITVDKTQTVEQDLVKKQNDYDVWNDDWSK